MATENAISRTAHAIQNVTEGLSLNKALEIAGLSMIVFHETLQSVRKLAVDYARAREIRSDAEVDEAKEIADDPEIDPVRARNMIDIRKWRASKHNSKVYGERIDLNVQQSISITDALSEARARLMPAPALPTLEADIVEIPSQPDPFS